LYRTYAGNASDQAVLAACQEGLRHSHEALERWFPNILSCMTPEAVDP